MTPEEFEQTIAEHYKRLGYSVSLTPKSYDYGVDVVAKKGSESIAIQAKMYDHNRQVNYQSVMYVFAGMRLYDCNQAIIITSGNANQDARTVAVKLGVSIQENWHSSSADGMNQSPSSVEPAQPINESNESDPSPDLFGKVWEKYIMPLKGQTLSTFTGKENTITDVDWNYVKRISSKGGYSKLAIEIFRQCFSYVIEHGRMTRDAINQLYTKRGSAIIFAVLSKVPFFDVEDVGKATLKLNREKLQQFKMTETHGG